MSYLEPGDLSQTQVLRQTATFHFIKGVERNHFLSTSEALKKL